MLWNHGRYFKQEEMFKLINIDVNKNVSILKLFRFSEDSDIILLILDILRNGHKTEQSFLLTVLQEL